MRASPSGEWRSALPGVGLLIQIARVSSGWMAALSPSPSLGSHQPLCRPSGGPAAMSSAGPAVARGVAAVRGLLARSLHRLHRGCESTGALRASVGSTEAILSDGRYLEGSAFSCAHDELLNWRTPKSIGFGPIAIARPGSSAAGSPGRVPRSADRVAPATASARCAFTAEQS